MTTLSPQIVTIITGLGGLVVPPVVSLIKRQTWSAQLKQLLAGALALAVAAAGLAITAPHDFGLPLATLAGLVYASSQVVYGAYFRGSVVETKLSSVGSRSKRSPAPTAVTSTRAVPQSLHKALQSQPESQAFFASPEPAGGMPPPQPVVVETPEEVQAV